jgi:hypothetical protein
MDPSKVYMLKDSRHELVEGLGKITQKSQQHNEDSVFRRCVSMAYNPVTADPTMIDHTSDICRRAILTFGNGNQLPVKGQR